MAKPSVLSSYLRTITLANKTINHKRAMITLEARISDVSQMTN